MGKQSTRASNSKVTRVVFTGSPVRREWFGGIVHQGEPSARENELSAQVSRQDYMRATRLLQGFFRPGDVPAIDLVAPRRATGHLDADAAFDGTGGAGAAATTTTTAAAVFVCCDFS